MKFAFYVSEKDRNWGLAEAVAESAAVHGDEVEIIPQRMFQGVRGDADGGACLGVKRAGKRLLGAHLQAGRHFLFFDKGYLDRANYVRVAIDAWQPLAYFRSARPPDRFERFRLKVDTRRNGEEILFAGSSQKYANFHDLGDATKYAERIIHKLRRKTSRPIVYRPKPSWAAHHPDECKPIEGTRFSSPGTPISEELKNCHLLVTHGSNAAVDALLAGVPVMALGSGVFNDMSMGEDYGKIEVPYFPSREKRLQFFYDLAYCQFTLKEFKSGEAWAELRSILLNLGPIAGAPGMEESNSLAHVVGLYRKMHEIPKYFRGREAQKHFAKIGRLVLATGARTLLDYGCGKGEQYQPPLSLQEAWGVEVACYDPGVERFAVIPEGTFDAVICCDVMEHLPEQHVDEILRDVLSRARLFAFLSIATMPASKTLPDGRNCHLTVKPESWWREQIETARIAVGAAELKVEVAIYSAPVAPPEEDDE